MGKFVDITGQKFGFLTVLKRVENNKNKKALWLCQCDCGNQSIVIGGDLRGKKTKSCGCAINGKISSRSQHGLKHTKLYGIWKSMKGRCLNLNNKDYKNYGRRGITVCSEWMRNFKAFYDWAMESGYKYESLPNGINKWTLDRINNDGNYEPLNCRWATQAIQTRNQKRAIVIDKEKNIVLSDIAHQAKCHRRQFYKRVEYGWTIEKALNTAPYESPRRIK